MSPTSRLPVEEGRGLDGLERLMTLAFRGVNLAARAAGLIERAAANAADADALIDLSIILQLQGVRDLGLAAQQQALTTQRLYQIRQECPSRFRLLAVMAPGDLMTNTPLEFLVANADIALSLLYLDPYQPVPLALPPHDAIFMAISYSEAALPLLNAVAGVASSWGGRVMNSPARIGGTARTRAFEILAGASGVAIPRTSRTSRSALAAVSAGATPLTAVLVDGWFPIIVRPVDSHAGQGLSKVDSPGALEAYLRTVDAAEFFVSRFIDYRNADGMFRKYRVALIDGAAFPVHMAISTDWMIHYLNAGMVQSASKRAEEQSFMDNFQTDFGKRHARALRAIASRFALDYLVIDCGETTEGELLVFEVCTGAVVHAMDPADLFPYKRPHMDAIFAAFRDMVVQAGSVSLDQVRAPALSTL